MRDPCIGIQKRKYQEKHYCAEGGTRQQDLSSPEAKFMVSFKVPVWPHEYRVYNM